MLSGSRAQVLAEHQAVLTVFTGTLLAGLVCAAALPRRAAREGAQPARAGH